MPDLRPTASRLQTLDVTPGSCGLPTTGDKEDFWGPSWVWINSGKLKAKFSGQGVSGHFLWKYRGLAFPDSTFGSWSLMISTSMAGNSTFRAWDSRKV